VEWVNREEQSNPGAQPEGRGVRLTTSLDFNLVALAEDDELTLMLELTAPPATVRRGRPPAAIEVVLDCSDSMCGTRLRTAVNALDRLVRWLNTDDRLGLVSFDAEARVVIPAEPLIDKSAVQEAIARIATGAGSNMSAGYATGIAEAGLMLGNAGVTVIVISDGHANLGARRAWEFERQAASAHTRGITTTTLALGPEADGRLLSAIASGGVGTALSATSADVAAALLGGEIDALLQPAVQAVQLEFHPVTSVSSLKVLSDVPVSSARAGAIVELGDLCHGEMRRLIVSLTVEAIDQPGEVKLGTITLRYVTLPSLKPHTFTLPLAVTVVPAPEITRRMRNMAVTSEGRVPAG
jgi:Ca-activated chloride channel family protein